MSAEPLARGDMSPRKMLEIMRECGMEDEAARFVICNEIGKHAAGSHIEALYFRDACQECEGDGCEFVTPYDDDLVGGLCEDCRDAAQDAQDQAMYRSWKL
jgi:hypothetical protein